MPHRLQQAGRPSLVWFRRDLRLADNPALDAAARRGAPLVPVFIWAPDEEGNWPPGAASRWWLHQSLAQLQSSLRRLGSRLIIRQGPELSNLLVLFRETGADTLFFNRRYEPAAALRDLALEKDLARSGLNVQTFPGNLLREPGTVLTRQGRPFQVFTPFWKTNLSLSPPDLPLPVPARLPRPQPRCSSLDLTALELEPPVDWTAAMRAEWQPGEQGALVTLRRFLNEGLAGYDAQRDHLDLDGTSRLSPHLHFGELSPRQLWRAVENERGRVGQAPARQAADSFLRQLGWREFAYHLLAHFPHSTDQPLRQEYHSFPWRNDDRLLRGWQKGQTGYPLVDAGMRQLWSLGWMPNRVRMVVASFLVKDLLLPWQAGARWFWDTLVDADLANNTLGWQWTAGCGADAAPFFRVFNPVSQAVRFDPAGAYVRRWVPELALLSPPWIHRPWTATAQVLTEAGVALGDNYPLPLVDHAEARRQALEAHARLGQSNH